MYDPHPQWYYCCSRLQVIPYLSLPVVLLHDGCPTQGAGDCGSVMRISFGRAFVFRLRNYYASLIIDIFWPRSRTFDLADRASLVSVSARAVSLGVSLRSSHLQFCSPDYVGRNLFVISHLWFDATFTAFRHCALTRIKITNILVNFYMRITCKIMQPFILFLLTIITFKQFNLQ